MKARWLLWIVPVLAGCGGGKLTTSYKETTPSVPAGQPAPAPLREVTRTMELQPDVVWTRPSAAEGLSHMKEMIVPAEGGMRSGGMEPFIERHAPMALVIFGGVLLAGGIVVAVAFRPFWKIGLFGGGGAGLALIVAGVAFESAPWLAPAILVTAIVGGLVWAFFHFRAETREKAALSNIVAGIEAVKKTEPDAAAAVTESIKTAAGGAKAKARTTAVVNAVKAKS